MFNIKIETEDRLQREICRKLLSSFKGKFTLVDNEGEHRRKGDLLRDVERLNRSDGPVRLVLVDMDSLAYPQNRRRCPGSEIKKALRSQPKNPNFLLRYAVWEAESWLLADWQNFKRFYGLQGVDFTGNPDEICNAKEYLWNLVYKGNRGNKKIKSFHDFVKQQWNPQRAAKSSKSLRRTLARLGKFPAP